MIFFAVVFAVLSVLISKSTSHMRCVVIDIYGLDDKNNYITATTYPITDFRIYVVFEPPKSYKLDSFSVKLFEGFGPVDLHYKMEMLSPTYRIGTVHQCVVRTFPTKKVGLNMADEHSYFRYTDNLAIGAMVAAAGFAACVFLMVFMMHLGIRVRIEDKAKEWARRLYELYY